MEDGGGKKGRREAGLPTKPKKFQPSGLAWEGWPLQCFRLASDNVTWVAVKSGTACKL